MDCTASSFGWKGISMLLLRLLVVSAAVVSAASSSEGLSGEQLTKLATALDPELMQYAPSGGFDPKYKTPCWKIDVELRCIPYVYVGGVFQSGSADLYKRLTLHREVVTTPTSRWHFWAEQGKTFRKYLEMNGDKLKQLDLAPDQNILIDGSSSTFSFYWSGNIRAHRTFQKFIVACHKNCTDAKPGRWNEKEDCLTSICYPEAMRRDKQVAVDHGTSYDTLHLPTLMAALYQGAPKAPKFVFMLRDPVERLHSSFWKYGHYQSKFGKSEEGFLKFAQEMIGALKACQAEERGGHSERECALYFETFGVAEEKIFFHADQVIRGMYSIFVEVWLRTFPRENIMFIRSEEFFADEWGILNKVVEFLDLTPSPKGLSPAIQKVKKPRSYVDGSKMLPQATELVARFYQPYNQKLAEIFADDAFLLWNKKYGL